ncbi:SDR family oxidoreductase [Methyloligella sp. 2.7D]|uniref:SDR family NAD(P)-dependent oxidoreductase n=1 Tax=unclassified Methyloligella TaxID=2625955 RepID=UPI00157C8E47|nr:SDR family oxidoreductase [Methyloligella sp. GL2]QKP76172.1 SDR family oxidoreductase [Methyloligella sp. GL2]
MTDDSNKAPARIPAAVVTGGNDGIGLALAREFAKGGHNLLLVARNAEKLAEAARKIEAEFGVRCAYTAQDLATEGGCEGVEQALAREGLYAEYLVNNAGLAYGGFFQDADPDRLRTLLDLNIRATVDLTRRLLIGMLARGKGGILNVSSMTGFMPTPYEATYAASKGFLIQFSRALNYETMWTGVNVSLLAPGVVTTDIHEKAGATTSRYLYVIPSMTPEQVAAIGYRRFMKRSSVIIPGLVNRILILLSKLTPTVLLLPVMGLLFRILDESGAALPPGPLPTREELEKETVSKPK